MRRIVRPAAAAVAVALAAAGAAVAGVRATSASLVSASFYANTLTSSHDGTCTGQNGDTYAVTDATFTGTASSSDPNLAGPLSIRVRSVSDTSTNVGWLTADVRITGASAPPSGFHGHLAGVVQNGAVQGFVIGNENGGGRLAGGLTTSFSSTGGFGSSSAPATIGSGSTTNAAVVLSGGACKTPAPPRPPHWPHPVKAHPVNVHVTKVHVERVRVLKVHTLRVQQVHGAKNAHRGHGRDD